MWEYRKEKCGHTLHLARLRCFLFWDLGYQHGQCIYVRACLHVSLGLRTAVHGNRGIAIMGYWAFSTMKRPSPTKSTPARSFPCPPKNTPTFNWHQSGQQPNLEIYISLTLPSNNLESLHQWWRAQPAELLKYWAVPSAQGSSSCRGSMAQISVGQQNFGCNGRLLLEWLQRDVGKRGYGCACAFEWTFWSLSRRTLQNTI